MCKFFAFSLVKAEGVDFHNSRREQCLFLQKLGFETVEYRMVDSSNVVETVEEFEQK